MRTLREGFTLLAVLTILTGLAYPLFVTGIAQVVFPKQANGSLIRAGGRIVGSELIGQPFSSPGYLWPRPSATAVHPYNAGASSGSNLGPLHPDLAGEVADRVNALRVPPGADSRAAVPVDLVTASASGLDPHVSVAGALYQVNRIALARGIDPKRVEETIRRHLEPRQIGLLGEPRVNVLLVNLDLDERFGRQRPRQGVHRK